MHTVEEALDLILNAVEALPSERAPLDISLGRVLATPILAQEALPGFDNSAVDGYAVRCGDVAGASAQAPRSLIVLGDRPAGGVSDHLTVLPGTAVRIMTGAPVPEGAEAVVMREDTREARDHVQVLTPAVLGENIRRTGEDVAAGSVVLNAGEVLKPASIALLAALGQLDVRVVRRPRVALVATGDELVWPDQPLGPGQIRAGSAPALEAMVQEAGGIPVQWGIIPDDRASLEAAFARASEVDLVLTTGGVSVGDHDLVREVLAACGQVDFWRINMQPGKPLAFGRLGRTPIIGLPGNPVSSLVGFSLFARPAIRKLMGHLAFRPPLFQANLSHSHQKTAPRRQYLRSRVKVTSAGLSVEIGARQGSHQLSGLSWGNALAVLCEGPQKFSAGDAVPVLLLEDFEQYASCADYAE
ncbi:MAG: gephyrin-like molybdotransferase Glp [Candidatus Sericytochromatia bacterium]|nr:gephyrin-like molybdotransferase Glp [Candidatus Sericytochromatia bacterium]